MKEVRSPPLRTGHLYPQEYPGTHFFRGWVDPRAHGNVSCHRINSKCQRLESIPGPTDLQRSALTTTLPQAPVYRCCSILPWAGVPAFLFNCVVANIRFFFFTHSVERWRWEVLVVCIAVLHTTLQEGAGNVSPLISDIRHVKQKC